MKLQKIYDTVITRGIEADPRGKKAVLKSLAKKKKAYGDLKEKEKEYFDSATLTNPYADTRILHGTGKEDIQTALVGIDMEMGEILLADRLSSSGKKVDLVLGHQ